MEPTTLISPLINRIEPFRLLEAFSLWALPVWIFNRLFPKPFQTLASVIPGKTLPEWVQGTVMLVLQILVIIALISFCGIVLFGIIKVIHRFLRWASGYYEVNWTGEKYRKIFFESLSTVFIRCALYATALAIYPEVLLNYHAFTMYLLSSHALWITIVPSGLMLFSYIVMVVLP